MVSLACTFKNVFLAHLEYMRQQVLAAAIKQRYNLEVTIPYRGESFDV